MSRAPHIWRQSESSSEMQASPVLPHPLETVRLRNELAAAGEEVNKLVHRVFLLPGTTHVPEAVAFCGVEEGAGCSWLCARAGLMLAGLVPGNVCLVDLNLRSPSLHRQLGLEKSTGVREFVRSLRPVREFARRASPNNLWLISAGGKEVGLSDRVSPPQLRSRFFDLRSEFDYILIDVPPASSCAEAPFLCQLADGIVLVVGAHSTRRERARAALEHLETAGVPILGAVLNKRTYAIPEALYRRL
jgi:protein-tyrosine kinase